MSIWRVSPQEDAESGEPFVRNTIAWDQLLNNLDLQTSFDSSSSSDGNKEVVTKSHASTFSEGKHSHQSRRLKLAPSSPNSRGCTRQKDSPVGAREDDGYSSEDEHDSPANQDSSESAAAGFCPSTGLTATTKAGSTVGPVSEPASPNDTPKAYFFVNGVRHCFQDEQSGAKWGALPMQKMPMSPKRTAPELPTWTTALPPPDRAEAAAKTVIASNDAGAPTAWVYTPKAAAAHTQGSHRSPPRYDALQAAQGSYMMPPTPNFRAMEAPPTMPGNTSRFATGNVPTQTPTTQPTPHAPSSMPMQPTNAAPFYAGNSVPVSGTASAVNSFLGYVYVDNEGRLCVASRDGTPQLTPSQVPSGAYLPPVHPATQQAQFPQPVHRSSAAAAALQGATTVPEMNPMVYGAAYAADGSVSQPAMPMMSASKPSSGAWGTTKAWAFRDGRWISLSM